MEIKRKHELPTAEQYAHDVLSGRIVACKLVKLACERYFDDRKYSKDKGIYFDRKAAERIMEFFHKYCHHSKGEWAGKKFELEPWQQFVNWNIFGWKNRSDGHRRFRTVYLEVGRKNGKSSWLAGIGNYMFIADGEAGAECYSAAVKREQALITHSEATRMVKSSPALKERVGIFRNNLHIENTASKFEPLGRDSDSCDGLNVHAALVDELHAHKTRDMWDVLETATGARRQPLQIAITTSGFNRESICWEQHEYLEKVLKGIVKDETYFGMIYTIDENDDWKDENCWIKGNPNLGISVKLDDLRRKAKKAKEIVSAQNNFLRKHLNVWVQQSTRWIDIDVWNSNYHHIINEERLRGRQFFGGLDLSSVSDLTAWVMVFPDPEIFEKVDVVSRFWCPESALSNRKNRYRNYYETWYREGLLKITPGDAIDYKYIKSQILEDIRKFDLIDMAVDRLFQGYQLCTELSQALGQHYVDGELQDKVIAVTPNGTMMTPALKELELRLLNKKINHGNNPILKWMADNLAIRETATGLRMPDKAESQGKIDGIVALLMALDRLMRHPVTIQSGSKYEREGLAVV